MGEYQLKTPKNVEKAVVGTYQKIEDTVVGTYHKMENAVVGAYKKVGRSFADTFLEKTGECKASQDGQDGPKARFS